MRFLKQAVLFPVFLGSIVWAVDDDPDDEDDMSMMETDDVFVATAANFQDLIKKNQRVLLEFYAPWCGHCKALEPEYKKAASELKTKKRKTVLAKCDATIETSLASDHGVQGYPTLVYYTDGQKSEYNGPRTADGIVQWVEIRESDPVEVCKDQAEVDEKVKKSETPFVVVAKTVKKSSKSVALKKAMQKLLAQEKADKVFACFIYQEKGSKDDEPILFYRTKAEDEADKVSKYTGKANGNKVHKWILESFYDKVGNFEPKLYQYLDAVNAKYSVVIAAPPKLMLDQELKKSFVAKFRKMNEDKKYKDFRFAVWEGTTPDSRDQIIGHVADPALVIMTATDVSFKKYVMHKATADNATGFVDDFIAGKLKPTWKTAPEPAEKEENGVTVLVGSTFEKIAYDPKKDVFVEFYAPWCGHCKKLEPEWTALAKKVKSMGKSKEVVIAKMDATENESEVEVQGFPKIVLFPAVKNSFKMKKEFQGNDRTMKPLLDFLVDSAINMEGVDTDDGTKFDKSEFNMVERERKKKQKKSGKKAEL